MTGQQEAPNSSAETFSLRELSDWAFKGNSSMRNFWGIGLIVELGVAIFLLVGFSLKGLTLDRLLIAIVLPGSFMIVTAVGYFRLGHPPIEATIDSESIRFVHPDGEVTIMNWNNASFKLLLREWKDYQIAGVTYPYKQDISPLFSPSIPLSQEAFDAIINGAREHGIAVRVEEIPGWWGTAHKEYHLRNR